MNIQTNTSKDIWAMPIGSPDLNLKNRTADDVEKWKQLVVRVIEVAKPADMTKAEVARRANMPDATFSQWFGGSYAGNLGAQNKKIEQWLDQAEEAAGINTLIPKKPPFQMTRIAQEITDTLALAQAIGDLVVITIPAGNGKTEACQQYVKTRPNAFMVTASPYTKTVHAMLIDLRTALGVVEYNPALLTRAIGERLKKVGDGTLLVVDEAQNLTTDTINQLRHFVDVYGVGLALVGNDEVSVRLRGQDKSLSSAQLKSRVGRRLNRRKPYLEDIETRISAWNVTDPDAVKYLKGIGLKAGALRQIDKTMTLASILAAGENAAVNLNHIKQAWRNRDVEEFAA